MDTRINDIFDEILGTTIDTFRVLREWGADVERLFFFYLYTAKIQKTNKIYATTGFCAKGLDIGEKRVQKAKNFLREVWLIQDKRETGDNGQAEKWYVEVSYIFRRATLMDIAERKADELLTHPVENGVGGAGVSDLIKTDENHPVHFATGGETDPQMLKDISFGNNNKMLKGKEIDVSQKRKREETYSCNLFIEFWKLYPRKIDKPKAWSEWVKLSQDDRAAAVTGVTAWLKLWSKYDAAEKAFIIYPERFLKNRRFDLETLASDLAVKLKARQVPGSGNKRTAAEIDEAKDLEAKAKAKSKKEEDEQSEKNLQAKKEVASILKFFESLPESKRESIQASALKVLEETGIAKSKEKFPKIYETALNSKIVQLTRPEYEYALSPF